MIEYLLRLICRLLGHTWYAKPDGVRLTGWLYKDPHNSDLEKRMASYQRATAEKSCERCGELAGLRWEEGDTP